MSVVYLEFDDEKVLIGKKLVVKGIVYDFN